MSNILKNIKVIRDKNSHELSLKHKKECVLQMNRSPKFCLAT